MNEAGKTILQMMTAAASIFLMGACGVQLCFRLTRLMRGQETADGLKKPPTQIPAKEMALAAGIALLSRIVLMLTAYVFYRVMGVGEMSFADSFEQLWLHWDTRHYIGIAQDGYTAVGDDRLRLVFFPLYPLMIRLFSPLTGGNLFLSGTVVSLICSAAATAFLYDLAQMHLGKDGAWLAVAYFLLSPMSVFLGCVYTEALFICLSLATVVLLRRGHPWAAALCGMLSAFTRMPGVIIAGLFIIAFLAGIPKEGVRLKSLVSCIGQVLLVFCGLFLYWGVNWLVTGDPMMYLTYQKENWYQSAGSFWQSAGQTMRYVLSTFGEDDWFFTWVVQLAAMAYLFFLLAFEQKKLPFDLAAYSFVYVAVVLSPTWLLSGARYLYALCALPILQAAIFKKKETHTVMLSLSGALLILFVFGYTIAIAVF